MIIAQISDTHIDSAIPAHEHALEQAVAHLARLPTSPDVVLITGDCTNNGSAAEYERFRELLRPLPMPVYVVPGNHDDRARMLAAWGAQGTQPLEGFMQYMVDAGPLRLIALDTHVPGSSAGQLCAERLGWLEARLAEAPATPTIIFMHHPPFLLGLAPLDDIRLMEMEAFGAIVARHPQIERIVAGHVHVAITRRFGGTLALSCPATHENLLPDVSQPKRLVVVREPPLCLLHVWNDATGLNSYTSSIGQHGPAITVHDGERWL